MQKRGVRVGGNKNGEEPIGEIEMVLKKPCKNKGREPPKDDRERSVRKKCFL